MNYIAEVNGFYNWINFNSIPADAQALWHLLMQMNNRCAVKIQNDWYWRVEFSVSNSKLTSILEFSRQQLDRMRNVLIQTGRIAYKKGKGSQSGTYKIIPFDDSIVENYVDSFPEKVWTIQIVQNNVTQFDTQSIVSNNFTQTVTQPDTQSGHKLIHKAGTNPNLCNIMSTSINSNIKNNNIYNNSFCGDDDVNARARKNQSVDNSLSDFLSEINSNFGITEDIKREAQDFTTKLFDKYFTHKPSKQDIIKVFEVVRHSERLPNGTWEMWLDKDRQDILEYAFSQASASGNRNWGYITGVLDNLRRRGLKTADDCENFDVERDLSKNGF